MKEDCAETLPVESITNFFSATLKSSGMVPFSEYLESQL